METQFRGESMIECHVCPECGSLVDEHSVTLECDHCLSKREE